MIKKMSQEEITKKLENIIKELNLLLEEIKYPKNTIEKRFETWFKKNEAHE
jgi:Holliday junction resolvasome RuvABC endonuclease subunit